MKKNKLFDFAIGNPPYQADANADGNKNYAAPVYHIFMDGAYTVADKVELITPARFLFGAGSTPKEWDEKMLNDPHLKVLSYEVNAAKVFPGTDIKGGVAVTYHDNSQNFGPIETFTAYPALNSILRKVKPLTTETFDSIISGRGVYRLSRKALEDYPSIVDIQSKGHETDVGSGAFKILENIIFFKERPTTKKPYVKFLGLANSKRTYYWTEEKYHSTPESFYHYKVFLPKANGSGALGEILSTPLIGEPLIGATETFLSVGCFKTESEAEACLKYIKSKFCRTMLGILKITQDNTSGKWRYVPMQNFDSTSDIDWSQSVHDIDQQLYRKYRLSDDEIEFIETHVKEMN